MTAMAGIEPREIFVSVREGRLVTERTLLTLGVPGGYVTAMREVILTSQSLGLGGYQHLLSARDSITTPYLDAVTVHDLNDGKIAVDGGNIHAWVVLPTLLDLLVDTTRCLGTATMVMQGIRMADELAVMSALATRYGAHVAIETDPASGNIIATGTNRPRPRTLEQWDPLLVTAMRDRFKVDEPMWRALYDLSNRALAPDSVLSRRHAGPVILLDDGTIVGRQPADDDFDPKMLQSVSIIKEA